VAAAEATTGAELPVAATRTTRVCTSSLHLSKASANFSQVRAATAKVAATVASRAAAAASGRDPSIYLLWTVRHVDDMDGIGV